MLILPLAAMATSPQKCTVAHVKEAMELNRQRRELYRDDMNFDAAKVLNRLILVEKLMLPFSYSLDNSVKELQAANIPMWCYDLIPMNTVPEYQTQVPPPHERYLGFPNKTIHFIKKQMKDFRFKDRNQLYQSISMVISNDLSNHSYNCVTRHFLESAARTLKLSDERISITPDHLQNKLSKATEKLIKQLGLALSFSKNLDKKAAPIQMRGVPVLCQEMPPIPWQLADSIK